MKLFPFVGNLGLQDHGFAKSAGRHYPHVTNGSGQSPTERAHRQIPGLASKRELLGGQIVCFRQSPGLCFILAAVCHKKGYPISLFFPFVLKLLFSRGATPREFHLRRPLPVLKFWSQILISHKNATKWIVFFCLKKYNLFLVQLHGCIIPCWC